VKFKTDGNWHKTNQRALLNALAAVRAALERYITRMQDAAESAQPLPVVRPITPQGPPQATDVPSALDALGLIFGLSPFERDLLLLCAGVEFDTAFPSLCAAAQGDPRLVYPTFGLALAALPGAHWSAITPSAPLRYWRLVEVGAGQALTTSPLRISERVLHYLAGVPYLDEQLHGLVEPVPIPEMLPPSHATLVRRIVDCFSRSNGSVDRPIFQLCGAEQSGKQTIAVQACAELGVSAYSLQAANIPTAPIDIEALVRLWDREAVLSRSALLLDCHDAPDPGTIRAAINLVERVQGGMFILSNEPLRTHHRATVRLDVNKPSAAEQRSLWRSALGPRAAELDGRIDALVTQFHLGTPGIYAASVEALTRGSDGRSVLAQELWDACRTQARLRLDDLAQRIEPVATWDDLVLPEPQRQILTDIVAHVRHRSKVYETWGLAARSARGLGISALFTGASGTGKTMAAEVLANELRLDLYRIDLSSVVSKYIGETEKNLRRVFDAAEAGGAILLFDEADALFGKRSEVKDSHDRYANIEVSYLLQRMEAYRGLAILTTNLKNALDPSFMRRIRFVVQFPFPDATHRAEIWRRIFPPSTPTRDLEVGKLARLNVAGGNIRNIALNAAFLAADADEPVQMAHLLRAAHSEYAKLEKPLTEGEIKGWM
jgi:hypothetical protein